MDRKEIESIMSKRGKWESFSHNSDWSILDYVHEFNIHCDIYPSTNEFEFSFVTPKYFILKSTKIGLFTNNEHFNKFFINFFDEVNKLCSF